MRIHREKLRLREFNNLTKSLSFNIYDICYAKSRADRNEYLAYIDEVYNSERLESILRGVTEIISARILNVSTQDYDPMGASVAILIAEGSMAHEAKSGISLAIWTRAISAPTRIRRLTMRVAFQPSESTSTSPPAGRFLP